MSGVSTRWVVVAALISSLAGGCKKDDAKAKDPPAKAPVEPPAQADPIEAPATKPTAPAKPAPSVAPFARAAGARAFAAGMGEPAGDDNAGDYADDYAGGGAAVSGDCDAACKHLVGCGVISYEACVPECPNVSAADMAVIAGLPCEQLQGGGAAAADTISCDQACGHVVECGANTMDGCLQLCASATQEQLAMVLGASCEEMLAAGRPQGQPAAGGSQGGGYDNHGGGTAADCAAVGGALAGIVCSGPPFPCRKLGCPAGWSCGVEGSCHNNQFPNCMRCP